MQTADNKFGKFEHRASKKTVATLRLLSTLFSHSNEWRIINVSNSSKMIIGKCINDCNIK